LLSCYLNFKKRGIFRNKRDTLEKKPKAAIIGAGCSGLTALKNLIDAGLHDVVCLEQNDQLGGNWLFSPETGHSSVCETTHIISSRAMSSFEDFPMPADYPDYPSHAQVWRYFHHYATHFNLLPHIRFRTRVTSAIPSNDGHWVLQLADGESMSVDYLLIANGHHAAPRFPETLQAFTGELLHSHQFKSNKPFRDKRVLVVGAGNSGCDCAVETSRVAAFTAISLRSPQYIIPKFFLGQPTDTFNQGMSWLPNFLANPLRRLALYIQVGRYHDYGLPEPDFPVIRSHPTLNSELLYHIRHGKVEPRPGIHSINGQEIRFLDGRSETFDTLIAATGYRIHFPFFSRDLVDWEEADQVPLYLRMFHPQHRNLLFIGLVQPQGAVWPLSEYQAKLAAKYILGQWRPPGDLKGLAERETREMAREFLPSRRHSVEVHFHPYLNRLKREIQKSSAVPL